MALRRERDSDGATKYIEDGVMDRSIRPTRMVRPEKRRRRVTAATIPDEVLIYEVLVRLPVKSLGRCRCVCRSWRAGIASAAFVRRHLELSRAALRSVLAIPREQDIYDDCATSTEISFHRLPLPPPGHVPGILHSELMLEKAWPEGITCLVLPAHCDGLVAIATITDRVFVCNPATREFVALPLGSHNAELDHCEHLVPRVALGFDQWRNRYIVARYFYRIYGESSFDEATGEYHAAPNHDVGHEAFTLGGGSSWELTQDPPHPVELERPICTRRAFYWHSDQPQPRLMRFSLQHRAFDVVPRPPTGWNPGLDDMAGLDDGKQLCYVHAAAQASFQVWMADDGPDLQWSLRYRIDLRDPFPSVDYDLMPLIADGNTLVAIAGGTMTMWRYDVQNEGVEEVVVELHNVRYGRQDGSIYYMGPPWFDYAHYIVPYVESLVSLRECNV